MLDSGHLVTAHHAAEKTATVICVWDTAERCQLLVLLSLLQVGPSLQVSRAGCAWGLCTVKLVLLQAVPICNTNTTPSFGVLPRYGVVALHHAQSTISMIVGVLFCNAFNHLYGVLKRPGHYKSHDAPISYIACKVTAPLRQGPVN
jgi:hypothetical protein